MTPKQEALEIEFLEGEQQVPIAVRDDTPIGIVKCAAAFRAYRSAAFRTPTH